MKRIKHIFLAIAAVLGIYLPSQAQSGIDQQEVGNKNILQRVDRIQKLYEAQNKSERALDKQQISQWVNFPNWPNWNNWNNWPNY